ncbi:MAG: choice-of-anchor H family protein [Gammaproteobacteria bacterium]
MNKFDTELQGNGLSSRQIFLSLVLLIFSIILFQSNNISAAERTSYSFDSNKNSKTKVNIKTLLNQRVLSAPELVMTGEQTPSQLVNLNNRIYIGDLSTLQQLNGDPISHSFSIFDANVELVRDNDGDGYYPFFRINFDADVNFGSAVVYARMYISFEGGPWNHYYTTRTFEIFSNDSLNYRTVDTIFSTGYPPGSYDIRIDLYEAGWTGAVAVYGPNEDYDLNYLTLEDEEHDQSYYYEESYDVVYGNNGGCTFNANSKFDPTLVLMFLLSIFYLFKRYNWHTRKTLLSSL